MRPVLGRPLLIASLTGVLALGLGACAGEDDAPDVASDQSSASPSPDAEASQTTPVPSSTDEPTDQPTAESGDSVPQLVDLVTATSAGGEVSEQLTPVGEADDLAAYLAQFTSDDLAADLRDVVAHAQPPDGREIAAAVVAVGCDVPPGVSFEATDAGYAVTADKVSKPLDNCFAPMTTVAVVEIRG